MGSFSWTRAEHTTSRANLTIGDNYKILVPEEFGGGYIVDTYFDYGDIFVDEHFFENVKSSRRSGEYVDGEGKHYPMLLFVNSSNTSDATINTQCECDLYGILAWWNSSDIKEELEYYGDDRPKNMYDILRRGLTWLQETRCAGIHIGCYNNQIDKLKYPLKLVSLSYKGSYEDCKGKSYGDPNQGFYKANWKDPDYEDILNRLIKLEGGVDNGIK